MSGEYGDCKKFEEEARAEDRRRWPFSRPPLSVRLLRAVPWVLSALFCLGAVVYFFVLYGVSGGLLALGGLLFVFVLIPFVCWLIQRHTG